MNQSLSICRMSQICARQSLSLSFATFVRNVFTDQMRIFSKTLPGMVILFKRSNSQSAELHNVSHMFFRVQWFQLFKVLLRALVLVSGEYGEVGGGEVPFWGEEFYLGDVQCWTTCQGHTVGLWQPHPPHQELLLLHQTTSQVIVVLNGVGERTQGLKADLLLPSCMSLGSLLL